MGDKQDIIVVVPSGREARKRKLEGSKNLLDWAISSQASNHMQPFVAMYDEGSTTILLGVESSDSKCRGSSRILEERDIVWSSVKAEVVCEKHRRGVANLFEHNETSLTPISGTKSAQRTQRTKHVVSVGR